MKYLTLFIAFLSMFNCKGQDTVTKHLSRSSVSIVVGLNIFYPTVNNYYGKCLNLIFANWFSLSYNLIIYKQTHTSIGLESGVDISNYEGEMQPQLYSPIYSPIFNFGIFIRNYKVKGRV